MGAIKILHIQGGTISSGAGRGAYWLHRALLEKGVDSRFLVQFKKKNDNPLVIQAYSDENSRKKVREMTTRDAELLLKYPDRDPFLFSPGMHGIEIDRIKEYKSADIIHLHWINWGFLSIQEISRIRKPIVWTFRDPWPFTGGCHLPYVHGCDRYKISCGCCPHLGSRDMFDLSWQVMRLKEKSFHRNIHPVAMSRWMQNRARESALFRDFTVELIPNNIDTRTFTPFDRQKAREILGLNPNKKIILFGTVNLEDKHKGLALFLEAMEKYPDKDSVICAFFGKGKIDFHQPIETVNFGLVEDDAQLRLIYASADVFVALLRHDIFSKTVGEAMACGLPVVNIRTGEQHEILEHKQNCYLAEEATASDIIEGIRWVLSLEPDAYCTLTLRARGKIEELCNFDNVAGKYIDLYQRILKTRDQFSLPQIHRL